MLFYQWIHKISPTRIIAMSFILVILTGTLLLCLPVSSRSGQWTTPLDALFTSTSATCVTGLIIADTYTNWSIFGQLVILTMIQIGGIGLMTIISMIFIMMKKKLKKANPSRHCHFRKYRGSFSRHPVRPTDGLGTGTVLRHIPLGVRLL